MVRMSRVRAQVWLSSGPQRGKAYGGISCTWPGERSAKRRVSNGPSTAMISDIAPASTSEAMVTRLAST